MLPPTFAKADREFSRTCKSMQLHVCKTHFNESGLKIQAATQTNTLHCLQATCLHQPKGGSPCRRARRTSVLLHPPCRNTPFRVMVCMVRAARATHRGRTDRGSSSQTAKPGLHSACPPKHERPETANQPQIIGGGGLAGGGGGHGVWCHNLKHCGTRHKVPGVGQRVILGRAVVVVVCRGAYRLRTTRDSCCRPLPRRGAPWDFPAFATGPPWHMLPRLGIEPTTGPAHANHLANPLA